jgi:hypothetical protein
VRLEGLTAAGMFGRRFALSSAAALAVTAVRCAAPWAQGDAVAWPVHVRFDASPAQLTVEVRPAPGWEAERLLLGDERGLPYLRDVRAGARALPITGEGVDPPGGRVPGGYRYAIDLESMLESRDRSLARRTENAILTDWSQWLLLPADLPAHHTAIVRFEADAGQQAFCAFPPRDGAIELGLFHLRQGVHVVFGECETLRFEVPTHPMLGAGRPDCRIGVAITTEFPRADRTVIHDWIEETLQLPLYLWGGAPMEQALITVLPGSRGSQAVFGRVLPSSAPTLQVYTGRRFSRDSIRRDWVLLHEMLHLGFPPVLPGAKWLDEGLATYLDPLLRYRAGWIEEASLWGEFVRGLPRGLETLEELSLAEARGIDPTYWGGALFCFLADRMAREETGGRRGIEDGLRYLLREGVTITGPRRSLEDLLEIMDAGIEVPVMTRLARRHVSAHAALDLDGVFAELGVERRGRSAVLSEDRPGSNLRHWIAEGGPASATSR